MGETREECLGNLIGAMGFLPPCCLSITDALFEAGCEWQKTEDEKEIKRLRHALIEIAEECPQQGLSLCEVARQALKEKGGAYSSMKCCNTCERTTKGKL